MADKKDKLRLIQQLLASAKNSIHSAEQLLKNITGTSSDATSNAKEKANGLSSFDDKVIEGIFDGQKMIGPDKKEYKMPENYASKSKLVEGDTLKLTIGEDGGFIFKQIGPVARKKIIGTLVKENNNFKVVAEGKSYKILQASVTYYKANDGDKVTIVVPEAEESEWGALENVVTIQSVATDKNTDNKKTQDDITKSEEIGVLEKSVRIRGEKGELTEQPEEDIGIDKIVEEKVQEKEKIGEVTNEEVKTKPKEEPKLEKTTTEANDEPTEGVKELEI